MRHRIRWTAIPLLVSLATALLVPAGLPVPSNAELPRATPVTMTTAAGGGAWSWRDLRLMNYYPSRHAWSRMWKEESDETVAADFALIRGLGA